MSSKFMRAREPKNDSKSDIQKVKELIGAKIIPIFGTAAAKDKNLPKEIERKFGRKFSPKDADGKRKFMGEGFLETEVEFKDRVELECLKYMRCHIKYTFHTRHIQHYKR